MLDLSKKIIQISLILIAFFSIINIVMAQESVSNSISSVNLNISPSNPRGGESVVLTLSSDLLDLNSSKIVWYIDGVVRRDTTSKSITIKTRNDSQKTIIRAVIETIDGVIKETSREISPFTVDLLVEPLSYIPPFYKGRPFFVAEGTVKIVALPNVIMNGVNLSSKDLYFSWTKDGNILGDYSGKGKDYVVVTSNIPVRDINIGVKILDDLGNVLVSKSKILTKNATKILFYENSPLYGILYNTAIPDNYYIGTKEEFSVVAKPFFFSFLNDTPSESRYVWSVNESPVASSGKKNEMILRQTTNLKGTAFISLSLSNINKINQYAGGGFNVSFGQ